MQSCLVSIFIFNHPHAEHRIYFSRVKANERIELHVSQCQLLLYYALENGIKRYLWGRSLIQSERKMLRKFNRRTNLKVKKIRLNFIIFVTIIFLSNHLQFKQKFRYLLLSSRVLYRRKIAYIGWYHRGQVT